MTVLSDQATSYVFLSYASAERELALHVADLLESHGISVWIDRKSIVGGTSWSAEIVRGIQGCNALVVLVSTASMASPNVQQELQLAWEKRRPLLPLRLDQTPLPRSAEYVLAGRQWVEIFDHADDVWLPVALRALATLGLASSDTLIPTAPPPSRHNLPAQLTSFVGRAKELAEVKRLLQATRLLTLTGPGGCGKTRLALQLAREVLGEYSDGVWLVELAALTDETLVPHAVLRALSLHAAPDWPAQETLIDYLRERQALLVVDNCEHLIDASAHLVASLLRGCPRLRVLVTSRELLGVTGEVAWTVPSLALPDPYSLPAVEVLQNVEAVRLFAERAAAVQPGFAVTAQNAMAVAQICLQLDGIPLAIELAAARLRGLSVEQIAARLDDRFRLLTSGSRTALQRQQTLRATVDWSYDLLSEPERVVFRRLSVFAGGWTIEAAEAVAGDVLDLLFQLVDKSLVVVDETQQTARYRFLEMIRQYAQEKLADAGETARCRDRQRDWCIALAEAAEPHLTEADPAEWLNHLDVEHDNLRAALAWCEESDPLAELRLVGSLGWFWTIRGYLAEGQKWLEAALGRTSPETSPFLRARALFHAGQLAVFHHHYADGLRFLEDSVELTRSLGRPRETAWALTYLGIGLTFQAGEGSGERSCSVLEEAAAQFRELRDSAGLSMALTFLALSKLLRGTDDLPSREQLEENLKIAREGGHKRTIAWALFLLGGLERVKDNFTGASALYEESLALFRDIGDRWATAVLLWKLGDLARLRGDYAEARPRLREALEYAHGRHDTLSAFVLCVIANLAIQRGELSRGVQLHGAAVAIDAQYARGLAAVVIADRDAHLASARASLGAVAFERDWAEGLAMPRDRAITLALAET